MPHLITLLTDFGLRDGFPSVMQGVIRRIAPEANIIDVTHLISPQNVREGALVFGRGAGYFPDGAIHVCVVDPGVGTARRPMAARFGTQHFVGPDNGLITFMYAHAKRAGWPMEFYELDQPQYWLPEISNVFHGRDLFAPVAAHLANGVPLDSVGSRLDDPALLPLSPYGVSKLAGELYLHYYAVVHGIDYAALRYSNVYGPRQDPHGEAGVVAIFGRSILEGRPITIFGDGRQERDYVFVEDVIEANWRVSTLPLPAVEGLTSRAWNIGTARGTSVNELADRLTAIAGRTVDRRSAPPRPGELFRSVLDISRAADQLGWRPRVSLDEGLRRTLAFLGESEFAEAR